MEVLLMIKAYLVGISSQFEGEDIEVRYRIYKDGELISKESILMEYKKPAIVGQIALVRLLKELEKYINEEIVIIVNDPALCELIRGTSTTKNQVVLNMAKRTKEKLAKFNNYVIKDVTGDRIELEKWNEILQP